MPLLANRTEQAQVLARVEKVQDLLNRSIDLIVHEQSLFHNMGVSRLNIAYGMALTILGEVERAGSSGELLRLAERVLHELGAAKHAIPSDLCFVAQSHMNTALRLIPVIKDELR